MSKTSLLPYLFFSGRCEEALEFYARTLDARVEFMMKFCESPAPMPEGMLQPGFEDKVMHATVSIGGTQIMVSDGCDDRSHFEGFRLVLSVATEGEAKQRFDALAEGGAVDMPLTATFWSPCYGMVTDRFRVGWMVMVPAAPPDPST